jgi:hypothetical protein
VTRWEPRQQVRFDKPLSLGEVALAMGCFVFAVLLAWAATRVLEDGLHPTSSVPHPVLALIVLAFFDLIPIAFGLVLLGSAMPRHVRIDWPTATLTIRGLWKNETPLAQIAGLEVSRVYRSSRSNTGPARARSYCWCELKARLRPEAGEGTAPLLLVSTEPREDPDGPLRQMLPLATELADALGVTQEVVSSYR